MEDGPINLIVLLVVLIFVSAFFSASETAFAAVNNIRLKNLAKNGNRRAKATLKLSDQYDTLLSTILIGNNIVNIATASIGTVIFTSYFGAKGVAYSTIFVTISILIIGEITPKSLAKESPEKFAMFATPILNISMKLLTPFNWFFMNWKSLLSKVFKVKGDKGITQEELITIIDEAQHEGGINEDKGDLIRSAVEFNELEVADVFTPRVNLTVINITDSQDTIQNLFRKTGYSRMPVYRDNIDNIIGIIHEKQFYAYLYSQNNNKELVDIIQPTIWTTESTKISKLLKQLQTSKSHMAVVTDEYGGTMGIVTIEDIIEELVGEIWDEHDEIIEEVIKLTEHVYLISGLYNTNKFLDLFDCNYEHSSNTVGGFVIDHINKIPNTGDSFIFQKIKITVTKTEFRRVLQIRAEKL